MNILPLNNWP